jgi:DNA-binding CsgD family transcriptional regulator
MADELAQRARLTGQPRSDARPTAARAQFDLTNREADVLALLVQGDSNRQIARALFISDRTVAVHVSRILDKLGSEIALKRRPSAHIGRWAAWCSSSPAADPRHGVVQNGVRLPEQCLYVASTTGPDPHSNPPRYYLLPRSADLADLKARITAAMSGETILTVDFTGPADPGVVVLNGGRFRSWCSAQPLPVAEHPGRAGGIPACGPEDEIVRHG